MTRTNREMVQMFFLSSGASFIIFLFLF
ncbi:hypothetical protein NC652_009498 [Populus alba x Populus x berolinensis]|nr:hypothetical protein NC652_009498 [Populus alba x Populus x berolinensis]